MSNSYFSFKKFTIHQDQCAMKVTTDSCILGAYAGHPDPGTILDIGSGSGVLALMVAQRFNRSLIHGVEIDKEAYEQSLENAGNSPWSDRINFFNIKIQEFAHEKPRYDLILCNPPYYQDQLKTEIEKKNIARHSELIKPEELTQAVNKLLTANGSFYVILPAYFFNKTKDLLEIYGVKLYDKLMISPKKGRPAYAIIGGFSRFSRKITEEHLFITDENGDYTSKFRKLLKEYYLAF